ncbi:putative vegetative cell wall protein gp1-like [Heracleum sosnowskyi]|uniref:Vegetative cell wall protein gp1-like n=1 Tax=Heracleum sosnowskyi TaxID=360622 RepID=A0AAD8MEK4_9APIA|nr:putative vegetative cell wall protein gp1-like [Heracleum sosnowskyi]
MASQQPPARPWFRLATMAARSAPPPQPDPVPQPRPSAIRPAFRATQTQEPAPSAPQAPVSEPPPPVATIQVPPTPVAPVTRSPLTAPAPAPTTPSSPITTATPAPSPIITKSPSTTNRSSPSTLFPVSAAPKATPSPIIPLPSSSSISESPKPKVPSLSRAAVYSPAPKTISQAQASAPKQSPYEAGSINAPATNSPSFPKPLKSDSEQGQKYPLEFEQKAVLVQETKEKPKLYTSEPRDTENPHKGDREASKKPHHKDKGNHKNTSNPNSSGMRVITVAGDNKGAIMELRPSRRNQDFGNSPGNFPGKFRTWGEGENSRSDSSSSSEEGKSKKDGKHKESMTKALSLPYVNSNVQAVNNSILFNATCTHHDPGVHISVSRTMGTGRGFKVKKHMNADD